MNETAPLEKQDIKPILSTLNDIAELLRKILELLRAGDTIR